MAISNRNDPELIKRLVAREMGIDPARIIDARLMDYGNEWYVRIKALAAPRRLMKAVDEATKILDDPFRREVVKVAVPDVFAALSELVKQTESAFTDQNVRYTTQAIYDLQKNLYDNRQSTLRHPSASDPGLIKPSGEADNDPFPTLPPFHP